jgi:hypothetical protein
VVLDVVGSNPTSRPKENKGFIEFLGCQRAMACYNASNQGELQWP